MQNVELTVLNKQTHNLHIFFSELVKTTLSKLILNKKGLTGW